MVLTMLPQVTFGAVLGTGVKAHSNSESQPSANYLLRFPQATLEIVAGCLVPAPPQPVPLPQPLPLPCEFQASQKCILREAILLQCYVEVTVCILSSQQMASWGNLSFNMTVLFITYASSYTLLSLPSLRVFHCKISNGSGDAGL